MGWDDDGEDLDPPPLPSAEWPPRPVPARLVRVARVVLGGFDGVDGDPLIVAWDRAQATVRVESGTLAWYADRSRVAFPRAGAIAAVERGGHRDDELVLPREERQGCALAVRSVQDLLEAVNATAVTAVDDDGAVHLRGPDDLHGRAVPDPRSGVILRASGRWGQQPWRIHTLATWLVPAGGPLLEPRDAPPPSRPDNPTPG